MHTGSTDSKAKHSVVAESKVDDLRAIAEKLEVINLQLAQRKTSRRKMAHYWLLISLCAVTVTILVALIAVNSPYLGWDYSDPETAVVGVADRDAVLGMAAQSGGNDLTVSLAKRDESSLPAQVRAAAGQGIVYELSVQSASEERGWTVVHRRCQLGERQLDCRGIP